ncbi:integrase, catalytic region, zinc finger, CCHC-type containing protein [Tanacetum coccineum]|uniref:Integrase, catalytic region, zinc finger, CCHC-type containing protein n=1 Tax=Tanacetum coccineum TaxID=301880 RepID=A0ABQ5GT58_9ASTR
MLCYLAGMEHYYLKYERRVVIQDQHLKSIIISCLPDDIMESVISCVSAKETWTDLVYSFEGPSDTKENRIMDMKLEYQTFRAKYTGSLSQTYTRYKTMLKKLANDGVNLSKHEINVGFINSLPKKWLTFSQGLRNANHTQTLDLADIYGRHTREEATILRDLVKHVKSKYPLDHSLESACRKKVGNQKKGVYQTLGYIWRATGWTITIVELVPFNEDAQPSGSAPWIPSALSNETLKPVVNIGLLMANLGNSKTNAHLSKFKGCPNCSLIGNVTISRVYYMEGLGHNLFSIGHFCVSNLEVTFRQHTCFIRNLEGVDLLTGSQGNNLYTLSLGDMMASSPICLLSNASKTKSWLWHRRLSHLNFGAINHLARHDNGTKFVNQTLLEYYEKIGISHETSVARSTQQNGVVERISIPTVVSEAVDETSGLEELLIIRNLFQNSNKNPNDHEGVNIDLFGLEGATVLAITDITVGYNHQWSTKPMIPASSSAPENFTCCNAQEDTMRMLLNNIVV